MTTTAKIHNFAVALDILTDNHSFLPITEYTFLAGKGHDVKKIYNQIKELYEDKCITPLNKRNAKNPKLLSHGNPFCETGLVMWSMANFLTEDVLVKNSAIL